MPFAASLRLKGFAGMLLPSSPVNLYIGDFPSWGQEKWPLQTNIAHLVGIYQQSNQLSKDIKTASNNMEENCWTRDRDRSKGFFAALRVSFIKAREDWVELSKNRAFLFVCVLGVYATIFKANFTRSEKVNSEKLYPSPPPQLHTCSYYYQGGLWKFLENNEVD